MPPQRDPLPYGRQTIGEEDIQAVIDVLRSDWLTTGPTVDRFEQAVAKVTKQQHAVSFCNGTAALHGMMAALGIGPGDEVIVPSITFAASANAVLYQGGRPVIVDVDPDTLLLDLEKTKQAMTSATKAIMPVDYAGQPCDYPAFQDVADDAGVALVSDAAHSFGGALSDRPVGSLAYMSALSFHPVKPITTGEGGMVVTDDAEAAAAMRRFRNHGFSNDHRERATKGTFVYGMESLGFNYRLSDIHSALGLSQLRHLEEFTTQRQQIATQYDAAFAEMDGCNPLSVHPDASSACHLYVVKVDDDRGVIYEGLREQGIMANVHYLPVHLHPYYQQTLGTTHGMCPVAEDAYSRILSLPIYPTMPDDGVERVATALASLLE